VFAINESLLTTYLGINCQASSFARDTQGPAPVISNVVKKMAVRKTRREMLNEQDKIVKFISKYQKAKASEESGNPFNYIITRPSEMVWDRPSRKKLEASKSVRINCDRECK
jgi:hypothetical protein